ncbi:hemerythrin domain-containing protein [Cellulomonas sp. P5_E12]
MPTTIPAGPLADVRDMYVVHRAFRREFGLLPDLIRDVISGDVARAEVVASHLDLVLAGLHMHHTGEDVVLWPLLLERAAPSADLIATMEVQHHAVDEYADQIAPLSADWRTTASAVRGEQLARLVEDFRAALLEHLDLEERAILPVAARHVTAKEWDSMGDHGVEVMTRSQLPLMFGAVLEEADDDERSMMLGKLPGPVRVLLATLGRWQYRRYVSRVRGG